MPLVDPIEVEPRLPDVVWKVLEPLWERLRRDRSSNNSASTFEITETLRRSVETGGLTRPDSLTAKLFLDVINDLSSQGWTFRKSRDRLLAAYPPGATNGGGQEQSEIKRRIRASLVAARDEQLAEPQNASFLRDMDALAGIADARFRSTFFRLTLSNFAKTLRGD